jgi:hypothetical protein
MSQPTFDLGDLFGAALQAVTAHRQEINALDGYNGNHGDNMVENVRMIVDAVKEKGSRPPAEALEYAGRRLQSRGRGGTSQYYARGLGQAAEQVRGHDSLDQNDIMSVVESILGAIPSQRQQDSHRLAGACSSRCWRLPVAGSPRPGPRRVARACVVC